jgi:tetratricopeptide (TPR) repeat protein
VARRDHSLPPAELVENIDTVFERIAAWVAGHPQLVLIALGTLIAIAAAAGIATALSGRDEKAAQAAVTAVHESYLAAMGAAPGASEAPEPANPEVGRAARSEFADKLLAAAKAHDGSVAAVSARLEAAELLEKNGDAEGAFAARKLAAEQAPPGVGASAIALARYAVALEVEGDLAAAAEAFEKAGEIESPAQALALADAARCHALLGNREAALRLYARAEKIGVEEVPVHVKQRLTELRASAPAKP